MKGRHVDTNEGVQIESQAVMNNFSDQDFQDACKKWQVLEWCISAERDYFEDDDGQ
jgi:hypothetical protein